MPTTPARVPFMVGLPQAVQRSLGAVLAAPMIPLVILITLGFAAAFAPVLAPHDKLQPVKPTAAQCLARFGFAECPYVDVGPPSGMRRGVYTRP